MKYLKVLLVLSSVVGVIFDANIAIYVTLALVPLWFVVRRPLHGMLGSLWAVRFEPGPSDLLSLFAWVSGGKWPSLPRTAITYTFGALAMLTAVHITMAVDIAAAIKFGAVTLYLILTMFVLQWQVDDTDWFRSLRSMYMLSVFITGGVLLAAYALWAVGLGGLVGDLMYAGGGETARPEGFFKDANVAGPFVVTGFAWLLSRILLGREHVNPRNVLLLVLLAAAVGVTFSRGALLNLGVTTIAVAWFAAQNWQQRLKWLVVAGLLVSGGYLGSKALFSSAGQADRFQATNAYDTEGRFVSWEAGWQTFLEHPLGIGPGQYETYSRTYQEDIVWNTSVTPSAHSTVMRVLTEGGVTGLFLVALIFWLVLQMGTATLGHAQRTKQVFVQQEVIWVLAALIGTLAESIIIDTLHWRHLWVLCGFVLAAHKLSFGATTTHSDVTITQTTNIGSSHGLAITRGTNG